MKLSEIQNKKVKLSSTIPTPEKGDEYDPTEGMSTLDKIIAGIGSGMIEVGRKGTNLVLPESITPEWASDKAIAEQQEIDTALKSTGAGLAGNILGQIALTAPIGAGAGSAVSGAAALSRGATLARALQASRAAGPGRAAVEGLVEGALVSNPGERLQGALTGGALSGGIGLAARGGRNLGRTLRVKKSDEAKQLEALMAKYADVKGDEFIPISHAAEEGLAKQFYEGIVGNIPSAGQKIRSQYDRALQTFRETAMAESLPAGVSIDQIFRHGDDIQKGLAAAAQAWDDAFAPIRNLKHVNLGKSWKISDEVSETLDKISGGKFTVPQGPVITGRQALDLREALESVARQQSKGVLGLKARNEIYSLRDKIEKAVITRLKSQANLSGQDPALALNYQFNMKRWPNWRKLRSAAESAGGTSLFSPRQLATKATRLSGKKGVEGGGGELQNLGKLGMNVLKPFPSRQGIFQTAAALGLLGGPLVGAYSPLAGLVGVGSIIGGGRILANKNVQRALMGEFGPKSKLVAQALRRSGRLARRATVPTYMETEENEP